MNERIYELAKKCVSYTFYTDYASEDFDHEKFAQLIIQDCIEIVEPCKCGCCQGEPEGIIADTIIKQIKEHFGVEE